MTLLDREAADTMSFADFYAATSDVLDRAQRDIGVRMTKGRFGRYLEVLQNAAKLLAPFRVDWDRERDRWRLFTEALSQCRPLVLSAPAWPGLDRRALQGMLRRVRAGDLIPPAGVEHDDARNTLLELEVVSCLADAGFKVEITLSGVDVIARRPEVPPFAVECKRPATLRAIERNIRIACDQVRGRAEDGLSHGICAIGVDRLVGLGVPNLPLFKTEVSFYDQLRRVMLDLRDRLEPLMDAGGFFPEVPIVTLSLSAAVLSFEDGRILTPRVFAPAVMVPERDPRGEPFRRLFADFGTLG